MSFVYLFPASICRRISGPLNCLHSEIGRLRIDIIIKHGILHQTGHAERLLFLETLRVKW